ncbi:microcin C ABC transporter ATP-binding protein YejF, partial [Alcaligenes faecalis subsp. faecalis NCIB 8687]
MAGRSRTLGRHPQQRRALAFGKLLPGLALHQHLPSGGQVLVQGQSREQFAKGQGASLSQTIQMVFQDPDSALNPRRSVKQLVTQVLELQPGMTPEQRRLKADELMKQVGLAQDAGLRFPAELSGGQKQRVNIALAGFWVEQCNVQDVDRHGLVDDTTLRAALRKGIELAESASDFVTR